MTRNRFAILLTGAAVAPLTALPIASAAGHSRSQRAGGAPSARITAAKKTVEVRNTGLGKILVEAKGKTLYLFKKDSRGKSACAGECAKFWPPLRVSGKPTAGSGISVAKLGTIRRSDGTRQATYNGHPLYTFLQDSRPGQTHGEGLTAFGATWFVLSPSGNQISHK